MEDSYQVELLSNALGAETDDLILDAKTMKVGKVTSVGQEGNYDIIYVCFGPKGRPRRINTMDDAQCVGRYHKIIRKIWHEEDE